MYHNIESYVCGMVCGVDFVVLADAKSQAKVKNMLEILNASNNKVVLNRNMAMEVGWGFVGNSVATPRLKRTCNELS